MDVWAVEAYGREQPGTREKRAILGETWLRCRRDEYWSRMGLRESWGGFIPQVGRQGQHDLAGECDFVTFG